MLYSASLSVSMTISSLYTALRKDSSILKTSKIKPVTNPLLNVANALMCVFLPWHYLHSSSQVGIVNPMVLPFQTSGTFCKLITVLEYKIQKLSSFKSNENIRKREDGSYYVVSANKASSVTL